MKTTLKVRMDSVTLDDDGQANNKYIYICFWEGGEWIDLIRIQNIDVPNFYIYRDEIKNKQGLVRGPTRRSTVI